MALIGSEATARPARGALAGLLARARTRVQTWHADASHNAIAQKVAGSALLIRIVSAAVIFGAQILFARWMGSFEFGIYVYVWAWVLVVGELADLGLGSAAPRFVPQYAKSGALDLLRGFIGYSRWIAIGAACVIGLGGAGLVKLAEPLLASYVVLPLMIACTTLPFYALLQVQDGIARSYDWIQIALLPMYVIRHVVMLAMVAAAYVLDLPTDAATVVGVLTVSLALTAAGQTLALNRRIAREIEPGPKAGEVGTWLSVSLPMLMAGSFYLLLAHTDVLVLQLFRSPDDIAIYYAATKTIALVSFIDFAVSAAVAHRFTEYHVTDDRSRLAAFLADAVRWTFWLSVAAATAILIIGKPVLSLFGAAFVDGYVVMFILGAGLLARASIGPVERLLTMLGQQRICAAVYALAFGINLLLCFALIPWFGIVGAAISTAATLMIESVLLFAVTKRRLKLHAFILRPRQAR